MDKDSLTYIERDSLINLDEKPLIFLSFWIGLLISLLIKDIFRFLIW